MLSLVGTGSGRRDITANGTVNVKNQPGKLGQIVVWNVGAGATIAVYDDPTTTNNQCFAWDTAKGYGTFALQYPMLNGITVVTAGGTPPSFSVVYQ